MKRKEKLTINYINIFIVNKEKKGKEKKRIKN